MFAPSSTVDPPTRKKGARDYYISFFLAGSRTALEWAALGQPEKGTEVGGSQAADGTGVRSGLRGKMETGEKKQIERGKGRGEHSLWGDAKEKRRTSSESLEGKDFERAFPADFVVTPQTIHTHSSLFSFFLSFIFHSL